ncbi:MAG: Ig-like domain-containing protein [Polyangiales bacterium]
MRALCLAAALAACSDPKGPELDASTACTPMSLAVTPVTVSIPAGMTSQLAAVITCTSGATRDATEQVNWQVFNTFVATVSSKGVVTAKTAGTTMIVADAAGLMGMATVTVTN